MGLNIRRSIKIGKHTRLNVSKSGIGISTGVKGARVSIGPRGVRKTVGIPGTGIYYTKQSSLRKVKNSKIPKSSNPVYHNSYMPQKPLSSIGRFGYRFLAVILFIVTAFLFLCGIPTMPVGIILWVGAVVFFFLGLYCLKRTKVKHLEDKSSSTSSIYKTDKTNYVSNHENIKTKIVGVTQGKRQDYLAECFEGQDLLIKNKPLNNYPHAMGVYTLAVDDNAYDTEKPRKTEHMLGYLNDDLAKQLYNKSLEDSIDDENLEAYDACIDELTGGTDDKPILGCNIEIFI